MEDENSEYDFEIAYHGKDIAEYTIQINNGTIENKSCFFFYNLNSSSC